MSKRTMTMLELQDKMAEAIIKIDSSENETSREIAIEQGRIITSIATQMINNARFILDAEKLEAQIGSLTHSKATDLIGD